MPTKPESPAAEAAIREAAQWASLAEAWRPDRHAVVWEDLPPIEALVIPEVDPSQDLRRRARRWSYPLGNGDLPDLALFAAALSQAEGQAWAAADRVIAAQAHEERRFLASDRILPWAVPWLLAVAEWFPDERADAEATTAELLDLGERHRLAPRLSGTEGLVPPGHDGFGPADAPADVSDRLASLWGGQVVFRRSIESITGDRHVDRETAVAQASTAPAVARISEWYEEVATQWRSVEAAHPGTARFWSDLSNRAARTARIAKSQFPESAPRGGTA